MKQEKFIVSVHCDDYRNDKRVLANSRVAAIRAAEMSDRGINLASKKAISKFLDDGITYPLKTLAIISDDMICISAFISRIDEEI